MILGPQHCTVSCTNHKAVKPEGADCGQTCSCNRTPRHVGPPDVREMEENVSQASDLSENSIAAPRLALGTTLMSATPQKGQLLLNVSAWRALYGARPFYRQLKDVETPTCSIVHHPSRHKT